MGSLIGKKEGKEVCGLTWRPAFADLVWSSFLSPSETGTPALALPPVALGLDSEGGAIVERVREGTGWDEGGLEGAERRR